MKRRTAIAIGVTVWALATLATIFLPLPAHAQEGGAVCTDDRKAAVAKLAGTYNEAPVNIGLASNGSVIEVFATEDGSTFTIALTWPNGLVCMMAAGENWESVPFKLKKDIRYGNPL